MKKLLLILFVIVCYLKWVTVMAAEENLKRIRMNLNEDEIGITFVYDENAKLLLISSNEEEFLILLESIGEIDLQKILKPFRYQDINPLLVSTETPLQDRDRKHFQVVEGEYEIGDIEVEVTKNMAVLDYYQHKFCVAIKQNEKIEDCTFLYLINPILNEELKDSLKVAIYDEGISEEVILKNYNNWIDTVRLSSDSYTTLLLDKETYNIFEIPKKHSS